MRNARELYRLRIENIRWNDRVIFNPDSRSPKGCRLTPMSDRVMDNLMIRCAGRTHGWVFASKHKEKHIGSALVNRQWVAAGLREDLVLYCARHDFGTYVLNQTGNLKLVMDAMGTPTWPRRSSISSRNWT